MNLIGWNELYKKLGTSRSTIDRWEKAGDFPKRINLGENSVRWDLEKINEWIKNKSEGTQND